MTQHIVKCYENKEPLSQKPNGSYLVTIPKAWIKPFKLEGQKMTWIPEMEKGGYYTGRFILEPEKPVRTRLPPQTTNILLKLAEKGTAKVNDMDMPKDFQKVYKDRQKELERFEKKDREYRKLVKEFQNSYY